MCQNKLFSLSLSLCDICDPNRKYPCDTLEIRSQIEKFTGYLLFGSQGPCVCTIQFHENLGRSCVVVIDWVI